MKSIDEDIKNGQFKNIYLLYGDEAYLRNQYRDKLLKALGGEDTMNTSVFSGKDVPLNEVMSLSETMPFLAERRVILLDGTDLFKTSCDEFAEYMKQIPDTTFFIFAEEAIDKRSRLYKAIQNQGRCIEFVRQKEEVLTRWILAHIKREHKQISGSAMHAFLLRTGDDMENIARELEKLLCYTLHKDTITVEDVENICTVQTENRIFDMITAVSMKQQTEALKLYYDLLTLKEPPMRILFLLAKQFNVLYQVKSCMSQGMSTPAIADKLGMKSFIVSKNVSQAGRFTKESLREAVEECVELEYAVKSGKMSDVMSVELLLIKYSN